MSEQSVPRRAPERVAQDQDLDRIADRIEAELDRLRQRRPAHSDRLDRAASILVTHLSCRRQGVIRVRVRQGRPRFLVSGSGGAVYIVNPADWSCTCPDYHRRGVVCKHGLACWVLARASRPAPKDLRCEACGGRFPRCELVEVQDSLTYFEGDLLCTPCWIESDAEVL